MIIMRVWVPMVPKCPVFLKLLLKELPFSPDVVAAGIKIKGVFYT